MEAADRGASDRRSQQRARTLGELRLVDEAAEADPLDEFPAVGDRERLESLLKFLLRDRRRRHLLVSGGGPFLDRRRRRRDESLRNGVERGAGFLLSLGRSAAAGELDEFAESPALGDPPCALPRSQLCQLRGPTVKERVY